MKYPDKVEVRPTNFVRKNHDGTSTVAFAGPAEKGADVDVLRRMVQFMAQRLMEIDFDGRRRLRREERRADKQPQWVPERSRETRVGTIDLKLPKLRQATIFSRS